MTSNLITELLRATSAATDVGLHDWLRHFWLTSGPLMLLIALGRWLRAVARAQLVPAAAAMLLVLAGGAAHAQEGESEVTARLRFLESHLRDEAAPARAWEVGWALLYVGGLGYAVHQLGGAHSDAARVDGSVGAVKAVGGAVGLALGPLHASEGAHPLDAVSEVTPDEQRRKVALAERLLLRNAREADIPYSWKPHVISLVLNLIGGAAIWAAGDFWRGAQSAALGLAVGEITIWTRPWTPRRDLRRYRREFGGLLGGEERAALPSGGGLTLALRNAGLQVAF